MNEKLMIFLIFVLLFAGIGVYWYFMEYTPLIQEKTQIQAEIEKHKKDLSSVERIEKEIDEKRKALDKFQDEFRIIENSVVTYKDMSIPDLIRVVRNYAKQAKVDFNEIKMGKIYNQESWDELPIDFNFTGPYHNISRMMARMENLKLINARKGKFSMNLYKSTKKAGSAFGNTGRTFGNFAAGVEEEKSEVSLDLSATSYIYRGKGGGAGVQGF